MIDPPRDPGAEIPEDELAARLELAGLAAQPLTDRDAIALELAGWAVAKIRRDWAELRELAGVARDLLAALGVGIEQVEFAGGSGGSVGLHSAPSRGTNTPPGPLHFRIH